MRKLASLAVAASFVAGSMALPAAAGQSRPAVVTAAEQGLLPAEYAARKVKRRRGARNAAAGAAVVGIAGALIGGAIAAQNRRDYYDDGYYGGGPAYGYYGGGPGYDPYGSARPPDRPSLHVFLNGTTARSIA